MAFTIIQTLLRHGIIYHFAFDEVNKTVGPFYRNHVNYAAMISIFYPLIWLAASWYKKGSLNRLILDCSKVLFTLGILFSYTRTAWLAILIIVPFTFLIRWRLTKVFLVAAAFLLPLVLMHLFSENRFLKYAPEYATTIYHDDLNEHLASTFEGKDVSGMERIYRWVAASRMIQDKHWMGFGPENFYPYYKSYTLNSFTTYVSDNEERSTVHNYFILTAVEQGIIGFVIFLSLLVAFFIKGEDLYHKTFDEKQKRVVMTVLVCMAMVMVNISLSDMLETDKVGSLYFIFISLLVLLQTNSISFDVNRE
jgi:O-antigen ligase